jgi:glycosyltransferase involved in cell wall biosynthesis
VLQGSEGPLVGWSFHPRFWPLIECVAPDSIVYHAYDLFHKQRGWTPQFAGYEGHFIRHARLVVASSEPIAEYLRERGARSVLVVENGVDYDAFAAGASAPQPADIQVVPHPRIGYVGALNRKVDSPLLVELASRRPEWHFVLIGACGSFDRETSSAVERLRCMRNVHFLGFKHHRDLPAYVSAMDVNLLAYRLGPQLWTEGIYPLKLHEYLASGRPVVGADLSTLRKFSDVVAIAHTAATWEEAVDAALIDRSPDASERRRAVARANTWEKRAALLERELPVLSR